MKKRIGLIQIDGKMPNLALMKLAAWHKNKGDDVRIIDLSTLKIDSWYGSKVFMGGSGYDVKQTLPKEIEAQVPDYEAFNIDYSMGFTSRGCIKDCGFCIVKQKEGELREVEFKETIRYCKYVVMDNNFLASPLWKEKLQYFIDNQIKVSFNQGLDITYINEENAEMLSRTKYYDRNFSRRCIYFAFDKMSLKPVLKEKLPILTKYIKNYHIMVYMLVGFDTTHKEDMERFQFLRYYNVDPFVMVYNNRKDKPELRHFARWVNKRIYKAEPDFSKYKINTRL